MTKALGNSTILVIDDDFASAEALSMLFHDEGYRVYTASDGEEALSILRRERVDLVVTELVMPKTSGTELCRAMKQDAALRRIPVILTTTGCSRDLLALEFFAAVFFKPFLFDRLLATVRALLDGVLRPAN